MHAEHIDRVLQVDTDETLAVQLRLALDRLERYLPQVRVEFFCLDGSRDVTVSTGFCIASRINVRITSTSRSSGLGT